MFSRVKASLKHFLVAMAADVCFAEELDLFCVFCIT